MSGEIVGVLLAAGTATRFGGDKLRARLPDGRPVARASAQALRAGVDRALAVVRPDNPALAELLIAEGLPIVVCDRAAAGMGASLARGVQAAPAAAGWLIALADMPFVRATTVAALTQALRAGAAITAPVWRGRRGHPVGFSRQWRAALAALNGDVGARDVLATHADRIAWIHCGDPGVIRDIDAPADLAGAPQIRAGGGDWL